MSNNRINKSRVIFGLLTIAVMVCIFIFSCENADKSSDTSGTIVDLIINIFYKNFNDMTLAEQTEILDLISHIIRKTAHFVIYAALGFFVFLTSGHKRMFCHETLWVLLFCGLYAVSDEIHQYFVPGRACMIRDMLLDTCGSITGITASFLLVKLFHRKK
ncbi:MAG: VanZ family protein [Ruminococcus sp.]|nr:VanZ family protein [Ruminococcus sp.]